MAHINITGRTTQFDVTKSNSDVAVAKGVTVDSQTNGIWEAAGVSGNDYRIDGGVTSHGFAHYALSFDGADTTVTVGESGKLKSDYWALRAFGDNSRIINEGRIIGDNAGIGVAGDNSHIVNRGTIISQDGYGIDTDGLSALRLDNSGTIDADLGLHFRIQDLTLNFGKDSIVELGEFGRVDLTASQTGWTSRIRNEGVINHDDHGMISAISGGAGSEIVRNTGKLVGFVDLDGGDDRYDGRGGRVIHGQILGGDGNDSYILDNSKDQVHDSTGGGYDTLKVSASYNLRINNEIEETYLTGKGDFNLKGNSLANYFVGNKGDNHLLGYAGDDAFSGGAGDDVMTGGAGVDYFHFKANADLEIITDFTDGEDLLVLFPGDEIKNIADLIANHAHQDGADLVIEGDGTEMIIRNFDKVNLTAADFTV